MGWFEDELDDDYEVGGPGWAVRQEQVREPFRTHWRMQNTRHYDVVAKMGQVFSVPGGGQIETPATAKFLWHLYQHLADGWEYRFWRADAEQARHTVIEALDRLDEDEFYSVICDMRWEHKLRATVTPATYDEVMRDAFARKGEQRILSLMRKVERTTRRSSAA